MELTDEIMSAFEAIAPELLPDCDVKYIPAECESKVFRKKIKECTVDELLVFTNCVLEEKNEFLGNIANILVSELAARVKKAECLYAVCSTCLPKSYPYISTANNVLFFSQESGDAYVKQLREKGEKVSLVKLEGEKIKGYFNALTRFGIEYAEIEPGKCKIRYKQKQLIPTSFDSISGTQISFLMLKLIQSKDRSSESKILKLFEATVLAAIANAEFACMGITVKDSFEALLITDKRDGSKWIPCFTDTMEIQETYTTIPDIAKTLMTSQVMTVSFRELERFMRLDNVAGVVINIGGAGLRINRETCAKIIASANNAKKKREKGATE